MATIVNTPAQSDAGSGMGFVMGILLLVVFFAALLYFGLPMLRNSSSQPSINVPESVDVNVTQPAPAQ